MTKIIKTGRQSSDGPSELVSGRRGSFPQVTDWSGGEVDSPVMPGKFNFKVVFGSLPSQSDHSNKLGQAHLVEVTNKPCRTIP